MGYAWGSFHRHPDYRHKRRRLGMATERLRGAFAEEEGDEEVTPQQRPTGWALKRRRTVQAERLRDVPQWVGIAFALALIAIAWLVYRETSTPRPLASIETYVIEYERMVGLVRQEFPPGSNRIAVDDLAPEAKEIGRGLGVASVQVDAAQTVFLQPTYGFDAQLAYLGPDASSRDYNGLWQGLEGRWFRVHFE